MAPSHFLALERMQGTKAPLPLPSESIVVLSQPVAHSGLLQQPCLHPSRTPISTALQALRWVAWCLEDICGSRPSPLLLVPSRYSAAMRAIEAAVASHRPTLANAVLAQTRSSALWAEQLVQLISWESSTFELVSHGHCPLRRANGRVSHFGTRWMRCRRGRAISRALRTAGKEGFVGLWSARSADKPSLSRRGKHRGFWLGRTQSELSTVCPTSMV
jgi:hypothetical protein